MISCAIPVRQIIHATFDIFDTEPRTWQLDFDEFCHWLETGERVLNSHGIMHKVVEAIGDDDHAAGEPPKGGHLIEPFRTVSRPSPRPCLECSTNGRGAMNTPVDRKCLITTVTANPSRRSLKAPYSAHPLFRLRSLFVTPSMSGH